MLIIKHTVETSASREAIWEKWSDVERWNTWDHGIEYSKIDGPFAKGAKGILKPKGGPLVKTHLTHVEPLKMFVDESKLFLAKIVVSHFILECGEKRLVTHQIEMKGLMAYFFSIVIGRTMKKNLPQEMREMVRQAEHVQ